MKKLILLLLCAMAIGCAPESSDKPATPTEKEAQDNYENSQYDWCMAKILKDMEDVRNLNIFLHERILFNNYMEFCQIHGKNIVYGYQCQTIKRVEERRGQKWN